MRILAGVLIAAAACTPKPRTTVPAPPVTSVEAPPPADPVPVKPAAPLPVAEVIVADSPKATVAGNTFIAPAGWSMLVRGTATILTPPEADGSAIALVDVEAKTAEQAVTLAWAAFDPDGKRWPLLLSSPGSDRDGWTQGHGFEYQTSPNEKRDVNAYARFANGMWLVSIYSVTNATGEKRGSQIGKIFRELYPKGYSPETFAGKQANELDAARLAQLTKFVETSMQQLGVPGVGLGIVQNGKVVFAGGLGVREVGKPAKIDGDTKFIVASNTKALTTLMLAKLVEEKKLTWDTTVTSLLPTFKLGDAATTSQVLVKHLICACTGLPRQDMEFIFESAGKTPDTTLATLGTMQPTSKFGELFQYSNPLAAAAGFVGGYVAFPKLELGKAYDEAMKTRVFAPLGMKATTFDFKLAKGNVAVPHGQSIDGKTAKADNEINKLIIPVRPAGGAWSTVRDMLKYVQMELDEGKLPGGKQYLAKDILLARRAPQVATGPDSAYGMGLSVGNRYGVTVISHGGDLIGFHSDMMWLPQYNVGAVVLTNGDGGDMIRSLFKRKLLEVLFDGKPEADAAISTGAKNYFESIAASRKLLTVPAAPAAAGALAAKYSNAALGTIIVTKKDGAVTFDFGEFKSEVATMTNPDGTTTFVTIATGITGIGFVAGTANGAATLTLRDAQHEYVFTAQ